MTKLSETIVFFGSGPVAAESLRLLAEDYSIEAVITKPKPTHHKGSFPVAEFAEARHLQTIYTARKADLVEQLSARQFKSRVAIVIDYGIIIPQSVIDIFPKGIINSHFSLLPKWRGADPITFSILSGDKKTGVSLMRIVEELDEGPLLAQSTIDITPDLTTPELTSKLIALSDSLIDTTLFPYLEGQVELKDQPIEGASYSRKLSKADGKLDFNKSSQELVRQVNAFYEWPKSYTEVKNLKVIVTKAHTEIGSGTPGSLYIAPKAFGFYTANNIFMIDRLVPSGKKEMNVESFLAGYKI